MNKEIKIPLSRVQEIVKESVQQERERMAEKIKARLKYCQDQNGLPYCKNCGLSLSDLEN